MYDFTVRLWKFLEFSSSKTAGLAEGSINHILVCIMYR